MKMLAVIVCMVALPAMAQWPSWSRPMQGSYDRGNQALSGAIERLTVSVGPQAWTNYITTNIWADYFSQAAKLKASKNMLKAAVDAGGWVYQATNWTPETSSSITASNLLATVGAPSGWWTNHPYVNISASSNGWRFWPAVVSNVVWDLQVATVVVTNNTYRHGEASGIDLDTAYALAASSSYWPTSSPSYSEYASTRIYAYVGCLVQTSNMTARISDNVGDIYYAKGSASTNYEAGCSLWAASIKASRGGGATFSEFDAQAYNVSTSYVRQVAYTQVVGSGSYQFNIATQAIPSSYAALKTWTQTNTVMNRSGTQGFYIDESSWKCLSKFNATTNGFKWFR